MVISRFISFPERGTNGIKRLVDIAPEMTDPDNVLAYLEHEFCNW